MHDINATSTDLDDPAPWAGPAPDPFSAAPLPTRVIEVGAVTAGIAVPEGRRVRFFASAPDFDGLDGAVFGSVEQAARAARERARSLARRGTRPSARRGAPLPA